MGHLGIIAGAGDLPVCLAQAASLQGLAVVVAAVSVPLDARLELLAADCATFGPGMLGAVIQYFHDRHVDRVAMAGKVSKDGLFRGVELDARFRALLARLRDVNDESLLVGLAQEFEGEGIHIEDQTALLRPLMPSKGLLSMRGPTDEEWADIVFGFGRAKAIGALDIGQTVVVKHRAVLAVEAIEGTDACVRRGGGLGKGGSVVVKVAKPSQDTRFDMPAVGLGTVVGMVETGASVLAIECDRTFLLERDDMLSLADRHSISVVATDGSAPGNPEGDAKS